MSGVPNKMYFRIGEVSQIAGVEPYVLRYWESEFDQIKPLRSNKQRLYRKKDVELILTIKRLLHEEGYTIAGAQKKVKEKPPEQSSFKFDEDALKSALKDIKRDLLEIKKMLDIS